MLKKKKAATTDPHDMALELLTKADVKFVLVSLTSNGDANRIGAHGITRLEANGLLGVAQHALNSDFDSRD